MRNNATIRDVAQLAGVSVATVSYVLNKTAGKSISDETTDRVIKAVEQLNYVSNSAARSLQTSRSGCVGIVFYQSFRLKRYSMILQGAMDSLADSGYNLMLCSNATENNGHSNIISNYLSRKIDGIIYISADSNILDSEIENMVIGQRIPFVACDVDANRQISCVNIDYFAGAYEAATNILKNGSNRIFYIRPAIDNRQERERELGIRKAAYEMNAEVFVHTFLHMMTYDFGDAITPVFGSLLPQITTSSAIIASWSGTDQHAFMFYREHALGIPFATLAQGDLIDGMFPTLQSSYIPNYRIGVTCAKSIIHLIDNPGDTVQEMILPTLTSDEPETATAARELYQRLYFKTKNK